MIPPPPPHTHKGPKSHTLSIQADSWVMIRESRVTQLRTYLMHTGKDAVLNPSVALWVSDCLLSYFHLLSSSTALFSSHLKSKGNKASAHPQLYSVLVQEDDPTTLPHAQGLTKTHVCAHKANNPAAKHAWTTKSQRTGQTFSRQITVIGCQQPEEPR